MATRSHNEFIVEIFKQKLRDEWTQPILRNREYILVGEVEAWMHTKEPGHDRDNVSRLLAAAHDGRPDDYLATPSKIQKALLVFAILVKHDCGHLILPCTRAGMEDANLDKDLFHAYDQLYCPAAQKSDIIQIFESSKWAWCPVRLGHGGIAHQACRPGQLLPFCRKERVNSKGGTADVWQVLVKAEALTHDMRSKLQSSANHDPEFGECYRLAIKTYDNINHSKFNYERDAYEVLNGQTGMVQYFGSYGKREPPEDDPSSEAENTFNLVLEYGEMDLDEFFMGDQTPPVLAKEIASFWSGLFKVAEAIKRIHNTDFKTPHGQVHLNGWHADIKPDNILRVNNEFKLTDFGFAAFQKKSQEVATGKLVGGTESFGAPESDAARRDPSTLTRFSQTIDTWSFGCVLSVAATWVILGQQGVQEYDHYRERAINKLRERHDLGEPINIPIANDAFHDGVDVLPEVTRWHNHLRQAMRGSDTSTGHVLALIDENLLIKDPMMRSDSIKLCEQLKTIEQLARDEWDERVNVGKAMEIDPLFADTLVEIDEHIRNTNIANKQAEEALRLSKDSTKTPMHRQPASVKSKGSPLLAPFSTDRFRNSKRVSKSKRIARIPLSTTAHRRDLRPVVDTKLAEEPEIQASSGSPASYNAGDDAAAWRSTSSTLQHPMNHSAYLTSPVASPISPTDADVHFPGRLPGRQLSSSTFHRYDGPLPNHESQKPSTPQNFNMNYDNVMDERLSPSHHSFYNKPVLNIIPPAGPSTSVAYTQPPGYQNSMAVELPTEAEIRTPASPHQTTPVQMTPPPPTPPNLIIPAGATPIEVRHTYPNLDIFRVRQELEMSQPGLMKRLVSKPRKDAFLNEFISNRDIVFIVDNASTMEPWWDLVKYTVETIAMKLVGIDDDGLDIKFTNGDTHNRDNIRGHDAPSKIAERITKAKPGAERRRTDMADVLGKIFRGHVRSSQQRRMTLLIFTDGIWEATLKPLAVEEKIAEFIRRTNDTWEKQLEDRQFSIEFISFGDNVQGLNRLRELDDEMTRKYHVKDIIDTEPWTGTVTKMILGSLRDAEDEDIMPLDRIGSMASSTRLEDPFLFNSPSRKSTDLSSKSRSVLKRFSLNRRE